MSIYLCEELVTTLSASLTFSAERRHNIGGIKIGLVSYNAPSGTFTLSLKSGATTLWSDTFNHAELKTDLSVANDYLYIFKAFSTDIKIESGVYTLEISASGYTYSTNSFLGWIRDTNGFQVVTEGVTPLDENSPYFVLLYENKKQENIWA